MIIGGGNAALCAAIEARRLGAGVVLLERAPRHARGGNSRHVRNLRVSHQEPGRYIGGVYGAEEFWQDLAGVAGDTIDEPLARILIAGSNRILHWMADQGVCFQEPGLGTAQRSRKTVYLLGGGKALLNALYRKAERLGVAIRYDSEVVALGFEDGLARDATVVTDGVPTRVEAKSVVVACGGIQSNIGWLARYLGDAAEHCVVRGSPYADGRVLHYLLARGAAPVGDPAQCHFVAVDARAPKFDGGIVTRVDGMPLGIVVDRNARQVHDEQEHMGSERYAIWGSLVLRCPGQIAYAIFDSKTAGRFRPSAYPPFQAPTLSALAGKLCLDPQGLAATIASFNSALRGRLQRNQHGDARTAGVMPAGASGAAPIDTPPFLGFPMRPGLTFSHFGVKVDESARVVMTNGRPSTNVFAAGLAMAANIFGCGYLAGMGMTIGTVFGRIAGREAARYALCLPVESHTG